MICFGVGITADALARYPSIEHRTVVELSCEVIESAPYFVSANHGVLYLWFATIYLSPLARVEPTQTSCPAGVNAFS